LRDRAGRHRLPLPPRRQQALTPWPHGANPRVNRRRNKLGRAASPRRPNSTKHGRFVETFLPWQRRNTAFRVARGHSVPYLDTLPVTQLYKPNRLLGHGRVMGESPLLRRVLLGAPPASAGPPNISKTYGQRAEGSFPGLVPL
jgi:hypothetical protein